MGTWVVVGYLTTGVLALLAALVSYAIYRIRSVRSSLSHIPGPKVPSFFFGHATDIQKHWIEKGNTFGLFTKWAGEFGNTFVVHILHTPWIVTSSPEAIKEVLVVGGHIKPARSYSNISRVYGQRFLGKGLITEVNVDTWALRRNILNPAFHKKYLKLMMTDLNACGNDMIDKLSVSADGKTVVRLGSYLNRVTLDIIGKVAFNKDINSIENKDSPLANAIFKAMYGFNDCVLDIFWWLKPWEKAEHKRDVVSSIQLVRQTCMDWLSERREEMERGDGVPEDLLTLVLQSHGINGVGDMDREKLEVILDDFVTMFVAGQETTANASAIALLEIGRKPHIFEKMKAEVDEVVGSRSEFTYEDLSRLEYTGAVFKEALRLYPVGPVTFRELARDTVLDGYRVPKGTIVEVNFICASRHPDHFEAPLEFRPERFTKDNTNRHNPYVYTPFSLGPRSCIGQNLAQMEGRLLLAKFAQRFNFHLDMSQSFDILEATTLKPKEGVLCTLTPRTEE